MILSAREVIQELAKQLAINHYNICVAKDNPDSTNHKNISPHLDMIFEVPVPNRKDLGFSRNILIVGAGASVATYKFFNLADKVIKVVYDNIGFLDMLKEPNSYLWKRFLSNASVLSGFVYDDANSFDIALLYKIFDDLGFEGSLKLLDHYYLQKDIRMVLEGAVRAGEIADYLPSLFCEVSAHLFKHRYIDVIINLNFDEMLDNSIDDDLGNSTIHTIINDLESKPFHNIVDTKRLRVPIYLKPHGSFRSKSSMKITSEDYALSPDGIKNTLSCIFSGDTESKNAIKRFNIILAGYSLNDIDVQKILFTQFGSIFKI
jgi:hypothetical protein